MASETEKTHALLQSCSPGSLISSLGLGLFCFVADRLLQFSVIQQNDWLRALSDNSVHCMIGMWSWAIVIGIKKKTDFGEIVLAGFLASVIDVDHFFLAGSLSLKCRRCAQGKGSLIVPKEFHAGFAKDVLSQVLKGS
ncbi:Transmembrane protein 267 [Camelus dromedarius]|uniref:Transmembrane protein 267 n=1 Tax=Camelus dromedarius TaxID=9838 RepID=A0A5N4ECF9_CAMDR|nr:Transmembrane protein 267 [Camelus dromedarius]